MIWELRVQEILLQSHPDPLQKKDGEKRIFILLPNNTSKHPLLSDEPKDKDIMSFTNVTSCQQGLRFTYLQANTFK